MIMVESGVAENKGKRAYMEDRNIVCHKLPTFPCFSLFGVFDGHGGVCAAEALKELLLPTVETHIYKGKLLSITNVDDRTAAIKKVLHNSILEVDSLFASLYPGVKDGSTAIVAMVWSGSPPILAVANVGDCRGLLASEDSFSVLSQDHKPGVASERARIEGVGGKVVTVPNGIPRVEGILAVSRAIGDCALKQYVISDPDITITYLTQRDKFFLLASDGMWDVVKNEDSVSLIRSCLVRGLTPTKAANEAINLALQRGGTDNVTCMIVRLNWSVLLSGQAQF